MGSALARSSVGIRARGMGGAGGAVLGPVVGAYNPGGLGVFSLEGHVGVYRSDQSFWTNQEFSSTLLTAGAAIPGTGRAPFLPRMAAGFAYTRKEGGFRKVPLSDGTTQDFIDDVDAFTLAVALEKGVQLGFGITQIKVYNAVIEEDADALDVGVFARAPAFAILRGLGVLQDRPAIGDFTPELAIALSYLWAGEGDYGLHSSPLDQDNLFARSVEASLVRDDLTLIRITLARDDRLDQISDIEQRYEGWEIDFGGVLQIQGEGNDPEDADSGLSFHSRGAVKWLLQLTDSRTESGWVRLVRSTDLYYERASIHVIGEDTIEGFGIDLNLSTLLGP